MDDVIGTFAFGKPFETMTPPKLVIDIYEAHPNSHNIGILTFVAIFMNTFGKNVKTFVLVNLCWCILCVSPLFNRHQMRQRFFYSNSIC